MIPSIQTPTQASSSSNLSRVLPESKLEVHRMWSCHWQVERFSRRGGDPTKAVHNLQRVQPGLARFAVSLVVGMWIIKEVGGC